MRVRRAPIEASPPWDTSTIAAAPAPARASNGVPFPGTTASETTTRATRADPAPMASAAPSSASMPAWVGAGAQRTGRSLRQSDGAGEHRVAGSFGVRRTAGTPPQTVDDVGFEAGLLEGTGRGFGRQRERVLVRCADRRLARGRRFVPTPRRRPRHSAATRVPRHPPRALAHHRSPQKAIGASDLASPPRRPDTLFCNARRCWIGRPLISTLFAASRARAGGVAEWLRQGSAKPWTRVRFPPPPQL